MALCRNKADLSLMICPAVMAQGRSSEKRCFGGSRYHTLPKLSGSDSQWRADRCHHVVRCVRKLLLASDMPVG